MHVRPSVVSSGGKAVLREAFSLVPRVSSLQAELYTVHFETVVRVRLAASPGLDAETNRTIRTQVNSDVAFSEDEKSSLFLALWCYTLRTANQRRLTSQSHSVV